jgi:undecaprenyl-diphosphatase
MILGLIQGLTEFLPVSSSGHLVIWEQFMHFKSPDLSFEVMLHFGTLFAVILYFWRDIVQLLTSLFVKGDAEMAARRRVLLYLAVSTVITGTVGILFSDTFERLFQTPRFCAAMLLVTATLLLLSDRVKTGSMEMGYMGWVRALIIGIGQAIAITPGISRSGTTIVTGVFCGLKREDAARYSFLLAIPAIGGAALLDFKDMAALAPGVGLGYALGALTAFISGLVVIRFLIELVKRRRLIYFSIYCYLFGIISLILL